MQEFRSRVGLPHNVFRRCALDTQEASMLSLRISPKLLENHAIASDPSRFMQNARFSNPPGPAFRPARYGLPARFARLVRPRVSCS
eukprot:7953126-Pyramimonas_sp.AAC.1